MAETLSPVVTNPAPNKAMERLVRTLEKAGYSKEAINYVVNAATNGSKSISPVASLAQASQQSVRQFVAAAERADETAKILSRRNYKLGAGAGVLALGLIGTEIAFATHKTGDGYESQGEALATNTLRVGIASAAGYGTAKALSQRKYGRGILSAAVAAGALTIGVSQVSMEQMESIARKRLAELKTELGRISQQEKDIQAKATARRAEIKTALSELQAQRREILSPSMPESLKTQRDDLQNKIKALRVQLASYNVKPGTSEYAKYVAQGFTNVGINADGDDRNDNGPGGYRELKAKAEAQIREYQSQLDPVLKEIESRTVSAGKVTGLSVSDQARITTIDASIAKLSTELADFDDGAVSARIQSSIARITAQIDEEQTRLNNGGSDLLSDFKKLMNTKDGANGMMTGAIFGVGSIIGGSVLHYSLAKLANESEDPKVKKAATTIFGHPISSLGDDAYVAKHGRDLKSFARMLATEGGVENALKVAGSEHLSHFRAALQTAFNKGLIPADRYEDAAKMLSMSDDKLHAALTAEKGFMKAIAGQLTETVAATSNSAELLAKLKATKAAAVAGRMGANVTAVGSAIGVGAVGLLTLFHSTQKSYAAALHAEGVMDKKAYDSYISMNNKVFATLSADIGISVADPTGIATLPVTLASEKWAQARFKEWYDKHGIQLNKDQVASLSTSLFSTERVQDEFIRKISRHVPGKIEGAPVILHKVIAAKSAFHNAVFEYGRSNPYAHWVRDNEKRKKAVAERKQLWDDVISAKADFTEALGDLGSTGEGMAAYLKLFPIKERLEYVRRLIKSETDLTKLAAEHPAIAKYIKAYNERGLLSSTFGPSLDNTISAAAVDRYLLKRFGLNADKPELKVITGGRTEVKASDATSHISELAKGLEKLALAQ